MVGRDRDAALDAVVAGWRADVAKGHQAAMYAWRRVDVAELNRRGREVWRSLGRLGDEELVAPGGTRYAVGDRVVSLAPGARGKVVTSETGTVVGLDGQSTALSVRMDDHGGVRLLYGEELGADRLAHSYAVTVHRSQGSTVERAHALEDGGGRELAYVKMSRAKDRATVYTVADSMEQATEDLRREWSAERRPTWVIDSGTPATDPAAVELHSRVAHPMRAALRRARLVAERNAIAAVIPPDRTPQIAAVERQLARLQAQRQDLLAGTGVYADQPVGQGVRERDNAAANLDRVERNAANARFGSKGRRRWAAEAGRWRDRHASAAEKAHALTRPELKRLDQIEHGLNATLTGLQLEHATHQSWIDRHPEAARRLDSLDAEIARLEPASAQALAGSGRSIGRPGLRPPPVIQHERGLDLGR